MSKSLILAHVEQGLLPVDNLCALTPLLANRKDPESPLLLNHIDRQELWRRWGFASMTDYIARTGIPPEVQQRNTLLFLTDERTRAVFGGERNRAARALLEKLLSENPATMPGFEFIRRVEQIFAVLNRNGDSSERTGAQ
jgi:hypothetical protein